MWHVSIAAPAALEAVSVRLLEGVFRLPAVIYRDERTGLQTISVYPAKLPRSPRLSRGSLQRAIDWLSFFAEENPKARVAVKKLPRENWAESWKRHFKPIEIGDALLIKPGWSRRRPRAGQRVVLLDPGLSFGTGHHATTSFCLHQLALCRQKKVKQSLLDIGSGSGILAIAAAKLGYSPVRAFDFDPEAIRVGLDNARKNRVADRVRPRREDLAKLPVRSRETWDVICANLTTDVLLKNAKKIRVRLKPEGQLIIAGVLKAEFRQICDKFATFGLTLAESEAHKEWQSGRFVSTV